MADQGKNAEHGNEEKKKDPMLFLHGKEQENVQKLVSQYQKIGEAEVGVQTDYVILCKDDAFQKDEGKSKCACHDMLLERVTSLKNKIEQLVSV